MTPEEMDRRIARCAGLGGDGADRLDRVAVLGPGTAPNDLPLGYRIEATAQPPGAETALRAPPATETTIVLSGRWRTVWGPGGAAGDVVLNPGDVFNLPAGLSRGYRNVGAEYGMIVTLCGGMTDGAAAPSPEPGPDARALIPGRVARYPDLAAMAADRPLLVLGAAGHLRDRPGYELGLLTRSSATADMHRHDRPSVLIPVFGQWRAIWVTPGGGRAETVLAPGDTMSVPGDLDHTALPVLGGEAALYHIVASDD